MPHYVLDFCLLKRWKKDPVVEIVGIPSALSSRVPFCYDGLMRTLCVTLGLALTMPIFSEVQPANAQDRITDQVAVTVVRNQVFAITPREGLARIGLSAGEEVLAVEARGINALVHTSIRLLGFSADVQRWVEQRTDIFESFLERRVTSRFILVRTNKRLYGFQSPLGRWKVEEVGPREETRDVLVGEHVAVVVTERRALAFSAFTGGFFAQDLQPDEAVIESTVNDNIVVLSTPSRRLIFRSQLAVWAELR